MSHEACSQGGQQVVEADWTHEGETMVVEALVESPQLQRPVVVEGEEGQSSGVALGALVVVPLLRVVVVVEGEGVSSCEVVSQEGAQGVGQEVGQVAGQVAWEAPAS